jgi:hypothetical protein
MTRKGRPSDQPGRTSQSTPKLFLAPLAVLIIAAITTGLAAHGAFQGQDDGRDHDERDGRGAYAIGLWGDLPYSPIHVISGVPNLIADMNAHDLAFTAHNGDLKQGSGTTAIPSPCDNQLYADSLARFNSLTAPAVFTPGDNDWTDCDRPANGGYLSLARLDYERQVFFSRPFSLGRHRMRQEVQTEPLCLGVSGRAPCVENRRWNVGGVMYATLNIPGSCNNLCDTAPDPAEYYARNQANIAWMRETFEHAIEHHSAAVMLISQANPGWDLSDATRAPLRDPNTLMAKLLVMWTPPAPPVLTDSSTDGYEEFLTELRTAVVAFRRPVAYVHGDSHYFRVDKPLLDSLGRRLENFTRVETFGDNAANGNNDVQWVKVLVNARSREVFTYQPQIVPGNRTAVPAPAKKS